MSLMKKTRGNVSVQLFFYLNDLENKNISAADNLLEVSLNEHVKDYYKKIVTI